MYVSELHEWVLAGWHKSPHCKLFHIPGQNGLEPRPNIYKFTHSVNRVQSCKRYASVVHWCFAPMKAGWRRIRKQPELWSENTPNYRINGHVRDSWHYRGAIPKRQKIQSIEWCVRKSWHVRYFIRRGNMLVLNYTATSTHIHFPVPSSTDMKIIPWSIQQIASRTA